jgi:hypothetical protein
MSIAPAEAPAFILNASHRCDACRSRAYVAAVLRRSPSLPNGGELLFCAHCFRKHGDALMPYLSAIVDETSQLSEHVRDDGHIN